MRSLLAASTFLVMLFAPLGAGADPGKTTYDKMCATCHGADGRGSEAKAKALKLDPEKLNLGRDEVAKQTRDEKRAITAKGAGKMPGYEKKLDAAELDAVIDYTMQLIAAIRK
jgi:mono/diheme cytochrome c family protein